MRREAGASGASVERSNRPVGHTPTRPEQDKGRMKNLARLGYEEDWQPYPGADEAGAVAAPERENATLARFVERLKLIASIAVIAISLSTIIAMFHDIPMLSG